MATTYYPLSPLSLPKGLTRLSGSYNLRALLAILAIILFFVLYLALVAGLAYLVYWACTYEMINVNKLTILMKVGAIAGTVMLLVFTLKFIFKLANPVIENRIKLDKKSHPELIGFVNQICKETGAPKPKSIYVDPDVNAYVAYSNMWLSLILPVRKDLTIGMGLVSCLSLSEFKAVVAHEFGHFAQSSMKIGSYIMSANTIIHDMIYNRDKWDNLLEQWRGTDLRLSAAAWAITPIIWLLRKLLGLFYSLLNIMYSTLSREMEFNADKVAVSVTGSEAIISALWKLDGGAESWSHTLNTAYLSAQKKLYIKNLYEYNDASIGRASSQQKETLAALPDDVKGGKNYFSGSERSAVSMYASHPPNDHREASAKTPFVVCEQDERSPWLLFSDAKALQEEMTLLVYKQYLNQAPQEFILVDEFEQFAQAETHGSELMAEYHNTFENRYLHIPEQEEQAAVEAKVDLSVQGLSDLKAELEVLMKPIKEIEALMDTAQAIANGTSQEKSFTFNENTYNKKSLNEGFDVLVAQRESLLEESFKEWDTLFCTWHLTLAKKNGMELELQKFYKQHRAISQLYKSIVTKRNSIYGKLNQLQQRDDLEKSDIQVFGHSVIAQVNKLNEELANLDQLDFVPLPNIDNVTELKNAIVENGTFPEVKGAIIENGGFDQVSNSLEGAIGHCQRLDQKSIGAILAFHDELNIN